MMKPGVLVACCTVLAACGGSGGCVGGPGEVALDSLRYDVCPGSSGFVGVPETAVAAMPTTSGDVTYEGVLRADVNGTFRDGSAQVIASFDTPEVVASGSVDFGGAQGVDIVAYNETVAITGNSFSNASSYTPDTGDTLVNGGFYGPMAEYAAGIVLVDLNGGRTMRGTFITQRP